MRQLPVAFLIAALTACTGPIRMHKAGATDADYQRDKKACEAHAARALRGQIAGQRNAAAHNRVLLSCMNERGWEQVSG